MSIKGLYIVLVLAGMAFTASALRPKTETVSSHQLITDIERTDSALRVGIRLQHYPKYWCEVSSKTRLMADGDTTKQYRLIGSENIDLDKHIRMTSSGYHDGVLLFEKVPESVKIVDMVEDNIEDVEGCIYGIHIDEEYKPFSIDLISLQDIVRNGRRDSVVWKGFDPAKYSDMSFYDTNGKVHVKGHILDYSPRYGFSTFSIETVDELSNRKNVNVSDIQADGSFEIDLPVAYPQSAHLQSGSIYKNLFLIPGDTLSIKYSLREKMLPEVGFVPEYYGFEGPVNDAVAVNIVCDSLIIPRYGLNNLDGKYNVARSDSMNTATYRAINQLDELVDSVVADLPALLRDMPISGYAKDCLSAYAIGKIFMQMGNLELDFTYANPGKVIKNEDGTVSYTPGEAFDNTEVLPSRLRHKDMLYNNPLILSADNLMGNRMEFSNLFESSVRAVEGVKQNPELPGMYDVVFDLDVPYKASLAYLDSMGVGNCFAVQVARSKRLLIYMNHPANRTSANLPRTGKLLAKAIQHNKFDKLNEILVSEYNNLVKDVLISENAINADNDVIILEGTPGGELLKKILAPYRGNVLFLDFWGINCGPCRVGMQTQKALVDKMADEPIRFLYISNREDDGKRAEEWLKKEGIKGEHIFLSGDDWQRMRGLFDFSAIPFGVLIGKNGKVIATGLHGLEANDPILHKAMKE